MTTEDQLMSYKTKSGPPGILTTLTGYRVAMEDMETINSRFIFNNFLVESLSHLNGERIPERVVHAKGTGAFGYFRVTHDLSDICRAKVFSGVGTTTPVAVRFSSVIQEKGGSDLARESKGFAIKFYTEEGNYDLVGLNTPIFHTKDPAHFLDAAHCFKKNPKTGVPDENSLWDFATSHPTSVNIFLRLFSDQGIPDGYRQMEGYGIHTFELINEARERNFVRFHILPHAGNKTLTTAEAQKIQGQDLDYFTRDLYEAIANHNYPSWTIYVQVISYEDSSCIDFDIFDITKIWPKTEYPLRPIGTLVLNRNPENQFAEVEQLAFNPGNLVDGIRGMDKQFETRLLFYRDAQGHRLGVNFNKIPVNCPMAASVKSYVRDGPSPVLDNGGESPNYVQNSFNGPVPTSGRNDPPRLRIFTDPRADNFEEASDFYENLTDGEKCRLVENVSASLGKAERFLQNRAVKWFRQVNADLSTRIEQALQGKTASCS